MDWYIIPQYHSQGLIIRINGRHLWNSTGINVPLFPRINARGSLTKLLFFCSITHWCHLHYFPAQKHQEKQNNSSLRQMEMKTDWLFESQILEDAWVRRFTSETYCESPNPFDRRMHHENRGKLKFKSSKSHARLKTQEWILLYITCKNSWSWLTV